LNRRYSLIIRKLTVIAFLVGASSVQASDDRMETVGNGLICMCSCNQLLSGCEMINCPSAPKMRAELKKHIDEGEDDKTILASFSAKYGPKVLSAPRTSNWFDLSAWVMPFVVLFGGGLAIVIFLKHLKTKAAIEGPPPVAVDASKYEGEIEEELRKLTPED
jgi:cytochrome c-type biogenesis protein CcmH/NrfF